MQRFSIRKLVIALSATGLFTASSHVMASAFQLWEQDAASVGNYHAGYAAASYDASTAFYNPAGLSRFKEQQLVVVGDSVVSDIQYRGNIGVNTVDAGVPRGVVAQGGNYGFIPALYYVAPYNDRVALGLSVAIPFGLKNNYGKSTILRYASTVTSVQVIDISPVISFKATDKLSLGIGPDAQMMRGEFNQMGAFGPTDEADSDGLNTANDTGYGLHAGILYEFNPDSRVGLSYHSQVVHHLTGTSKFSGQIAAALGSPMIRSERAKLNMTLPPYTALSVYHKPNSNYALMASVIYTQWQTIQNLVLQDVSGVVNTEPSNSVLVIIPQHFHNTFNVSIGADYFATDKITLRGGIGYDQTPVQNAYRNVQLPDNNRYAFAVGTHIQSTSTLGFDLGWSHIFIHKAHVSPPPQVNGDEVVTTNGSITGSADVLAAQVVWDMV